MPVRRLHVWSPPASGRRANRDEDGVDGASQIRGLMHDTLGPLHREMAAAGFAFGLLIFQARAA